MTRKTKVTSRAALATPPRQLKIVQPWSLYIGVNMIFDRELSSRSIKPLNVDVDVDLDVDVDIDVDVDVDVDDGWT